MIANILKNPDLILKWPQYYIDLLFIMLAVNLLSRNRLIRDKLWDSLLKFAFVISIWIIIEYITFRFIPGLYSLQLLCDYEVYFNHILGVISFDKNRPCWFFAEPSYSAYFLGAILLIQLNLKKAFKDKACLISITSIAILATSSTGTLLYLPISLLAWIFEKAIHNSKLLSNCLLIILVITIIIICVILPTLELYEIINIDRSLASYNSRQERMLNATELYSQMSIFDILLGLGPDYVSIKYKMGISDTYNKLLTEEGLLFMATFMFMIYKFLKQSFSLLTFVLFSFLTICIFYSPIMLITYGLVYIRNKQIYS